MLSATFDDRGGRGQWPRLFRRPHKVQGHFPWPWNFIYNPRNLLHLSGRSWFQFSIRAVGGTDCLKDCNNATGIDDIAAKVITSQTASWMETGVTLFLEDYFRRGFLDHENFHMKLPFKNNWTLKTYKRIGTYIQKSSRWIWSYHITLGGYLSGLLLGKTYNILNPTRVVVRFAHFDTSLTLPR